MVSYKEAGVNIEEGYKSVDLIKKHASKTFTKGVLNNLGSFAGMFELPKYKNPVLISGTDGVGTKLDIVFRMKKYNTVGIDCVAMCVNDILCHGAKPLFFLDYIACGKLEAEVAAQLVEGVSNGCIQSECALIGGETAEMPGFYRDGEYDIAGFAVGIAEKDEIIDGSKIEDGDILIGIASSGPHSNGYSLIRKLVEDLHKDFEGDKIGNTLLTPTKIYVKPVMKLLEKYNIKGIINKNSYPLPNIFSHLMSLGIEEDHMYNTFNMGIGFVLCVNKKDGEDIIKDLIEMGEKGYKIGYVKKGDKSVELI